jgi:AcrR family transcriptional regulator
VVAARVRTDPRKVPRQARSQETVQTILDATARVLVKDGFDRATTNRIAEVAGVSIGSLYQYFPNKEALVAALIDRHVEETHGILQEAFTRLPGAPLEVAAQQIVELMIRAHQHDPKLHRVLAEQVPRTGYLARLEHIEAAVITNVREYLRTKSDQIRPRNIDLAAWVVVQSIEALTHAAVISHPEYLETEEFASELSRLLLDYLGAGR